MAYILHTNLATSNPTRIHFFSKCDSSTYHDLVVQIFFIVTIELSLVDKDMLSSFAIKYLVSLQLSCSMTSSITLRHWSSFERPFHSQADIFLLLDVILCQLGFEILSKYVLLDFFKKIFNALFRRLTQRPPKWEKKEIIAF